MILCVLACLDQALEHCGWEAGRGALHVAALAAVTAAGTAHVLAAIRKATKLLRDPPHSSGWPRINARRLDKVVRYTWDKFLAVGDWDSQIKGKSGRHPDQRLSDADLEAALKDMHARVPVTLREWGMRPLVINLLKKANACSALPEITVRGLVRRMRRLAPSLGKNVTVAYKIPLKEKEKKQRVQQSRKLLRQWKQRHTPGQWPFKCRMIFFDQKVLYLQPDGPDHGWGCADPAERKKYKGPAELEVVREPEIMKVGGSSHLVTAA